MASPLCLLALLLSACRVSAALRGHTTFTKHFLEADDKYILLLSKVASSSFRFLCYRLKRSWFKATVLHILMFSSKWASISQTVLVTVLVKMLEELLQTTTAHYYIDVSYLVLEYWRVKKCSSPSVRLWLSCNVNCTAILATKGRTEGCQPLLENLSWSKPCDESEISSSFPSYTCNNSTGLDSGRKSISEMLSFIISSPVCAP